VTEMLTPEELAARWRQSTEWVRTQARKRTIPATKIGGRWRFDPAEIQAYEDRHRHRDPLSLTPTAARRRGLRT